MVPSRVRTSWPVIAVALTLVALLIAAVVLPVAPPARAQGVQEFWLGAQAAQITLTGGVVWNAWTYNGTVPGPTLRVRVGDTVRIHFTNNLDRIHSIHAHGLRYTIESDGSQAYPDSMPGPGETYTYTFEATRPGLFYYHCHSSDRGTISQHILQGLYGAIIVYSADAWPPDTRHEFVQFFAEAPTLPSLSYVINGAQASEHALWDLVDTQGYPGALQTLKGAGISVVPVSQELTFYLIGIGNEYHSWHMHGGNPVYVNGQVVEGDVIALGPGSVATAKIRLANPGIWLIHCHLVFHADLGMVTLMIAE
jgi:FtsP/CotA-like multicopper oxidase with cupredoxin domain